MHIYKLMDAKIENKRYLFLYNLPKPEKWNLKTDYRMTSDDL